MKPSFNLQENYERQILHWHNVIWTQRAFIYFCLKPTRDLSGRGNELLRETERQREQIGETGLIRAQSCHQISQLNSQKTSTKSGWIKIRRTVWPNYWRQRHHPQEQDRNPDPLSQSFACDCLAVVYALRSLFQDYIGIFLLFCLCTEEKIKDRGDSKLQM